jgi:hypothetical protein
MESNQWAIQELWNELLLTEREVKPRNYIRASEMGKSYLDRYLAMKGVPVTNKFDARILRVFDCGFIFEQDVVERIFRLLGLVVDSQKEVKIELPNMLPVIGHYDYKVGGTIDRQQREDYIMNNENISPWMKDRSLKLLEVLAERYPNGMKEVIAEIKSVNSRAFWSHKNADPETGFFKGYPHHKLQLYTYLRADSQSEGRIFYVSKDDLTLLESAVVETPELKKAWEDDVEKMTFYYKNDKMPPREDDIIFNEDKGEWEKNWKVARSNYFTYITGFDTVDEWEKSIWPELKRRNSKPCKKCGKVFTLTTLNKYEGYCGKCYKTR